MLNEIKQIIANATEKQLEDVAFQKYIKTLIMTESHWCKGCYSHKPGKYLRNNMWYCFECILTFNEE